METGASCCGGLAGVTGAGPEPAGLMTEASLHFGQLILKGTFGMDSAGNSLEKPHLGHVTATFSIYLLIHIDICCIIYEKSVNFKSF